MFYLKFILHFTREKEATRKVATNQSECCLLIECQLVNSQSEEVQLKQSDAEHVDLRLENAVRLFPYAFSLLRFATARRSQSGAGNTAHYGFKLMILKWHLVFY